MHSTYRNTLTLTGPVSVLLLNECFKHSYLLIQTKVSGCRGAVCRTHLFACHWSPACTCFFTRLVLMEASHLLKQLCPTRGLVRFVRPSWRFSLSCMQYKMTTWPYFDNLNFDIFDAMVLRATLPRLHCTLPNFHVSNDTGTILISIPAFYWH